MAFETSDPLSNWVTIKDESEEGNGAVLQVNTNNRMNPIGFEEITVEIHPVEFNPYCKRHENSSGMRTVSVDTFDLGSYLARKNGFLIGKTIAVDTSDLEAHYEFYRYEQRAKISKTVSTDTHDLECRVKPRSTSSIAVDTDDLVTHISGNCYINISNSNVSVVRDGIVGSSLEVNGRKHCLDTSWTNGVFTNGNYKSNGENHPSGYKKTVERMQETVFIKSDLDINLESNTIEHNMDKSYNPQTVTNSEELQLMSSNGVYKSDIKELKETRPLLLKKDMQTNSYKHKNQSVITANVGLNNESDISDSDNGGDIEDNDSHSNDSNGYSIKRSTTAMKFSRAKDGDDTIEGSHLEKDLKSEEESSAEGSMNGEEGKFECDICKATFTRKHSMMVHLRIHNVSKSFSCEDCGKAFPTFGQLRSHVRTHSTVENLFECKTCGKRLSSSQELKYHSMIHSDRKMFECAICSKVFQLEKQLKTHQCSHEDKQQPECCTVCGRNFRSASSLYNHLRVAHKTDDVQPVLGRMKTPFECLTCGKVFRCRTALRCHETVHTGERNFVCETCNKAFPTKASLKAHSSTHTGLKPFVCTTCGKAFAKNDSLKTHIRKHTGERPFRCDICGQAFDRNFTLKNHRVTHTGEKTHICPMCGKAFATRGALSTHERTRHNTNPEKPRKPYKRRVRDFEPCVCDVCGKVYSNQANLRIHKATHTGDKPFLCTVCGQSFAKKYTLQCHTRKHTDERPFPCDICGLTFFRNHTLKTHKLRHTGERPHVCSLCGKSFIQSASLAYHIRNHDRPPKASPKGKKRKKKPISEVVPVTHTVFGASPYDHHPLDSNKIYSEYSQHEVLME